MPKERILITVKTYPTLSSKYDELVCTAGFREDGTWVRIYPIPFRKLEYDSRYAKYQWIEVDLVKNTSDPRPESYRPYDYEKIIAQEVISTGKDRLWIERKKYALKNVYTDLDKLIREAKDKDICTSLATFKPSKILDFKIEKTAKDWDSRKLARLKARAKQTNMFEKAENPFEVVKKVPFKFSYHFKDIRGKESTLMIEDWEICQLYWNVLKRHNGDEAKACEDVKKKYFDDFALTKDLYLFLGTTRQFHFMAPNPFLIIGTFHPKPEIQGRLF
ncbi:MAG: hypothetical protein AAFV95_21195 [Bacteroidota bacterium]